MTPTIEAAGRASRATARSALLGLAAAGIAAVAIASGPATAQLAPGQPGVATPYGRAPLSFADLIDRVKPSVVSIKVSSEEPKLASAPRGRGNGSAKPFPDLPDDHPLNEFFKSLPPEFRGGRGGVPRPGPRARQGQGSGFLVSADGYVVTNNHVIDGAKKITVTFEDKTTVDARLIGTDARTDIALLKIDAKRSFQFVRFAKGSPRVGDWAIAVGNPFGLGGTVTAGIVSALSRDIGSGPYDYIQIDAAVNRGNSGGPTFNLDGDVIGVNTAIYSPSGGNVGIAFAVPAATASEVIEQLKQSGTVKRGWLGVKIQNVDEDVAASLGLKGPRGALISEVTAGGPAASAGLQAGDAIVKVNNDEIADSRDLARKVAEYAPDSSVDVQVRRGNRDVTIKVKLGTFPGSGSAPAAAPKPAETPSASATTISSLGVAVAPLDAAARRAGAKEGVVIRSVTDGSDAETKGLREGDVIVEVNSQKISAPDDIEAVVKRARELGRPAVLMKVTSGGQTRLVAVQMKK
ncbi:MAG: Do family serine endopeptidase [Hyphomicrobiaceae bacterium]